MKQLAVYEAKTRLSELLDDVQRGDEVLITRHGHPVARLVAAEPSPTAARAAASQKQRVVATFKAQEEPEKLLYSAALLVSVGVLMGGWGLFVHLNRSAEELEPEAMEDAKSEDHKVDKG